MAGIPPDTNRNQVDSGFRERQVSKLKEDLKKAQEDLNDAKKQAEFYKKTSEKLKEQLEQEDNGRKVARRNCFKLKRMCTDLIRIISDLVSFSMSKGRRNFGVDDGCFLDNGNLKMLEEIPARLQTLLKMVEDAKSEDDLNYLDDVLYEIMERIEPLKSKVERTTAGDAALSNPEDKSETVKDEEENDNGLAAVSGKAFGFVEGAAKSGGRRMSKKGSESGLGLSSSFTYQSSSGFASDTQEQEFMDIDEDGQTEVASRRSPRPAPPTNSNVKHGKWPGNFRRCLCGFTSKISVSRHIWRVTAGRQIITGTHVCSICEDRFQTDQGLQYHLGLHQPKASMTIAALIQATPTVIEDYDNTYDEMPVLTKQSPVASTSVSMMPGATPQDNPQSTNDVLQSKAKESASNTPKPKCQLETPLRSKTEEWNFRCPSPSCGKRFLFESTLRNHCISAHKMMNPASTLNCRLCEESFTTYAEFLDHQYAMHIQSE